MPKACFQHDASWAFGERGPRVPSRLVPISWTGSVRGAGQAADGPRAQLVAAGDWPSRGFAPVDARRWDGESRIPLKIRLSPSRSPTRSNLGRQRREEESAWRMLRVSSSGLLHRRLSGGARHPLAQLHWQEGS
jgi:hypothetical protein